MKKKISIKIAGAAGQGPDSSGQGYSKVLKRCGMHVFGLPDFMSLIKGGHNFFSITMADAPVYSATEKYHVAVCFDPQNVQDNLIHIRELHENGIFIIDDAANIKPDYQTVADECNVHLLKMPLVQYATEIGGNKIMMNTVSMGAIHALLGLEFSIMDNIIRENFAKKSPQIAEKNSAVAKAGYDWIKENASDLFTFEMPNMNPDATYNQMLINGNESIAFGSYTGGCRFISAYPMTPGTTVFEWFTKRNAELGVVTKHVEDEVASLCMAIGAGQVGARPMTTTSGGGFCLMVEALGLAGITEVGVVVVNAQRGGPSTGLPTRVEQPDLLFAINASHGEFPRAVLTPGTIEECYEAGWRAHNLAAKYQTPVIILTDLNLAFQIQDINPSAFQLPTVDMGKIVSKEELDAMNEQYLRFALTKDGISPKALPGHPNAVNAPATDEHDESGKITECPENRIRMMEKRMQKQEGMREEIIGPAFYGEDNADATLVCWGGTYGQVREAVELFNSQDNNGQKINMLHFKEVWPFPTEKANEALSKCKFTINIEQNFTSQFAKLLRQEIGYEVNSKYNKYNGQAFTPEEIVKYASQVISENLVPTA